MTTQAPTFLHRLADRWREARYPNARQRNRWIRPTPEQGARVADSLRSNYFSQPLNHMGLGVETYLATPEGRTDLDAHLRTRLLGNRRVVAPWLDSVQPLDGAEVLEIGCGTGSSTVSLAEQGARVHAVDVNGGNLAVARDRCAAYGLDAAFYEANAVQLADHFAPAAFDLVVFWATLEHLTLEERRPALRAAWQLTRRGGALAIFEAPNRLWWFDFHTSDLPFYHWLPDDYAIPYARWSPRPSMVELYADADPGDPAVRLDFARRGRGVSYHDVELALGALPTLRVAGNLFDWMRRRDPLFALRWALSRDGRYQRALRAVAPTVPRAFLEPGLSMALRKTT